MAPGFKNLNKSQKFSIVSFVLSLSKNYFSKKIDY